MNPTHRPPNTINVYYVNAALFGLVALQQALGVIHPTVRSGWTGTRAEIVVEVLVCLALAIVLGRALLLNSKEAEVTERLHTLDVFTRTAGVSAALNGMYRLAFKS